MTWNAALERAAWSSAEVTLEIETELNRHRRSRLTPALRGPEAARTIVRLPPRPFPASRACASGLR